MMGSPTVTPSGTVVLTTNTPVGTQLTPSRTSTNPLIVQLTGTPTPVLLAPEINGPTPTIGTPSNAEVLIPVTGADLSEKLSERKLLVSRIHQLQSGLNFIGFGLMLIGLVLMRSKKEE
jgi:hypothetical protein